MSDIEIRRATIDDAEAIAEVHVASWRWAYAGLLDRAVLDGLSVAERAAKWREWIPEPEVTVLVALRDDELVGFAAAGPNRTDPKLAPGEVYAIYLLEEEQGRGTGYALFRAAIGNLRAHQRFPLVARVLASNARARAFYERCDGHVVAESVVEKATGRYSEVVYRFD